MDSRVLKASSAAVGAFWATPKEHWINKKIRNKLGFIGPLKKPLKVAIIVIFTLMPNTLAP
jgi:hypothetical protein